MEKYGFVYIWMDKKHKRYYIGCHWGSIDDGYVCSSPWMRQAYKHRPQDFKRRILKSSIQDRKSTYEEEQRWLDLIKPEEIKVRYYNLQIKNNEVWHKYDEKVKTISEKISIRTKEAMADPEIRKKWEEGYHRADRKLSDPETRRKRSESMKKAMAKKFPVENRWKPLTPEERTKYYSEKAKKMHADRKAKMKSETV
jgi:hypothetical protein